MTKDYAEIGTCFERALWGETLARSFDRAIWIMKTKPELVARIPAWDDMMWLNIEEYLNSDPPTLDIDGADLFLHACALLEAG